MSHAQLAGAFSLAVLTLGSAVRQAELRLQ